MVSQSGRIICYSVFHPMEDETSFPIFQGGWQIKKPLSPNKRDKSQNFCGTTQIDIKISTHFAYHHMHLSDNGRGSRQRLLLCIIKVSSCPHKSIRKNLCCRISPDAALLVHPMFRTSLVRRFNLFYYSGIGGVCQAKEWKHAGMRITRSVQ